MDDKQAVNLMVAAVFKLYLEDRPHSDQMRAALAALTSAGFRHVGPDDVVVPKPTTQTVISYDEQKQVYFAQQGSKQYRSTDGGVTFHLYHDFGDAMIATTAEQKDAP